MTNSKGLHTMQLEARSIAWQRRWHQAQINHLVARLETGGFDREVLLSQLLSHQQQLTELGVEQ